MLRDLPVASPPLQLWGGSECTVNRVGEAVFDQLELTGQTDATANVERAAALGVRALRVPVLWERVERTRGEYDWRWSDAQLMACRRLGIEPIVGLLHHGSGPRDTHLLNPEFAARFARYARAVAERYPWVRQWTPVNEPLTTARFSALYGFWYPHRRSESDFLTALLHQSTATVRAMGAIRDIVPGAQLLQTEDLGRASSSPALQYQRDYENERRWWSLDLLFGRVDALRGRVGDAPLQAHLDALAGAPCAPDVIGINHYVTSNRHLDERLDAFPGVATGGNGRDIYVDVEAVRVAGVPPAHFDTLIAEAWSRYGRPLALTEVHLDCSSDEQLRWMHEAWRAAQLARRKGIDVRAVTAWGLFGQVDWHCLVTRADNRYTPGVFDRDTQTAVRGPLALMLADLALRGRHEHPALLARGWWRDDARLRYFPDSRAAALPEAA